MIDTAEMRADLMRTGRKELLERIHLLCDELDRVRKELADALLLPGWFCPECRVFNGEAKSKQIECRSCQTKKEADYEQGNVETV